MKFCIESLSRITIVIACTVQQARVRGRSCSLPEAISNHDVRDCFVGKSILLAMTAISD
jgi:hypothetical protein